MTMKKDSNCGICKEEISKYKCPRCKILYCSVQCFKLHRESADCIKITENNNPPPKVEQDRSKVLLKDDDDSLSPEKLKLLATSTELSALLKNPHLKQILTDLDVSSQKEKLIDQLMKEPIFIEFADICLQCLETNNGNPMST